MEDDRLLTSAEVLALIPISYPTLLRYVRSRHLPPGRLVGGLVTWRVSEIEAFIESLPRQTLEPTSGRGRPKRLEAAI